MALTERLALIIDASTKDAVRGIQDVAKASDALADSSGKSEAQLKLLQAQSDAAAKQLKSGLAVGAGVAGAALLAGFGAASGAAANFDKAISGVASVSNATSKEMESLRAAALQAGKDTAFSASEAATAEAELAKAGVSTADILGGALSGALSLASAGQLDLAEAATIAAQAMNVFDLAGSDVSHVADVLAAAANKSAADVKTLGDGLRQGGLVAKQTGLSLEETVGTLALFADQALVGSDAGTSLKTMLMRLIPQSADAASEMKKIGLAAHDASGEFVGWDTVADQLHNGLGKLSDAERAAALNTIFGSDATRAASIIYEGGAAKIREYVDAVNDNGAAARMASTQMDNLAGDVEALKGSLETALIGSGSGATGVLRTLTQTANGLVGEFLNLPPAVQAGTGVLAGVTGVALTGAAAFGTLAPRIQEARKALETMGSAGQAASGALGVIGKVGAYGAVAAAGVGILTVAFDALGDAIHGSVESMPELDAGIASFKKDAELSGAAADLFGKDLGKLDKIIDKASEQNPVPIAGAWMEAAFGVKKATQEVDSLDKILANLHRTGEKDLAAELFGRVITQGLEAGQTVGKTKKQFDDYRNALLETEKAAALASDEIEDTGTAITEVGKAAASATPKGKGLFDTLIEGTSGLSEAITEGLDEKEIKEKLKPFEELSKQIGGAIDIGGVWSDVEKNAGGSLKAFSKKLDENIRDVEKWREDLNKVAARGAGDFSKQLEVLGPTAAGLVAKVSTLSEPEFEKMRAQFANAAKVASVDTAMALSIGMQALPIIGRSGGQMTAEAIAAGLGYQSQEVIDVVAEMAKRAGVTLAQANVTMPISADLSPLEAKLQAALQKYSTSPLGSLYVGPAQGSKAPAAKNDVTGLYAHAEGGIITKPEISLIGEAGAEAVIPLSSSKRGRAMEILDQAGLTSAASMGGYGYSAPPTNTAPGVSVSITIGQVVAANPRAAADEIVDRISEHFRRGGAMPPWTSGQRG